MSDFEAIPDELKDRDQWLLWDASADSPRQPSQGEHGVMTRVTPTAMSQEVGDE